MTDQLITARRAVNLPWIDDGRIYELTAGRGNTQPEIFRSPTTYACMNIRGQELANIPWHIKRDDKILEKHVLIDMLTDFGDESNYHQGLYGTEVDQLSYGAGLWLRDINQLERLDPTTIEVKKTNNGISGFWQYLEGPRGTGVPTHKFKRDEVVYFREYNPNDALGYGIPVVNICKKSIKAEIEALLMIEAFFRNDAVPGLWFTSDDSVSEPEANRFIDWFNKKFRGSRNKAKVGVGGKGMKPTPIGANMREAQVIEILEYCITDICRAMRVDKKLVGSSAEATYQNMSEIRKLFIENTMMPRANEYQSVINQDLVRLVDDSVVFEYAFEEMPILQADSTAKQTRLSEALGLGAIDIDYFNVEMGYPAGSKPKEPDNAAIAEDKMERKALKALLRGESPNVEFETDHISIDRQHELHARLSNAKTEDAVRACFD